VKDLENVLIENYQAIPKNDVVTVDIEQSQTASKTDPETGRWSSYQSHYNRILAPWRNQSISMLEIGEQNAQSLEEWARYFVNAQKIVGCDINPSLEKINYDDPRIHTVIGNINHPEIYQKIHTICPQFDLIVDAGSHKSVDILLSFAIYFRFLKPGGVYIVEDTYTQYDENYGGGVLNERSVYGFFKRLIDVLNYQFWEDSGIQITTLLQTYLPSDKLPKFIQEGWIDGIEFRNSLIIIHKAHEVGHQKLGQKLLSAKPSALKQMPLLDSVIEKVKLPNGLQGIKKDVAVVVFIPGYPQSSMIMSYMEVADTLVWGFKQLGFNVKKSINQIDPNCTNVVIGFQIPAKIGGTSIGLMRYWPSDTIVYNLEQYAEHEGFKNTIGEYVVNKFQVWDYSLRNLKKWQEVAQNRPPLYVPIGYAPILEKIPHKTEDIDLFFCGSLSAERLDFVNRLTNQVHLQRSYLWGKNVWGDIRDEMIGRSKLVLNLTGYHAKNTIFEIVRVSYLLANSKAVICQKRENVEIEPDILESGLLFLDENNFDQQVHDLLANDKKRLAYAEQCKAAFCQRDIRQILAKTLNL
jgi:SAM-dependent methyltransferase